MHRGKICSLPLSFSLFEHSLNLDSRARIEGAGARDRKTLTAQPLATLASWRNLTALFPSLSLSHFFLINLFISISLFFLDSPSFCPSSFVAPFQLPTRDKPSRGRTKILTSHSTLCLDFLFSIPFLLSLSLSLCLSLFFHFLCFAKL